MKKVILMAGAVLMSAVCLGQVKTVKKAQNLVLSEVPNYEEARKLMQEALENPETKDQANTWYVAGLIGYQQSENELTKRYLGQQVDYNVVGMAQVESYKYWEKAYELAGVLVQDKKGNMVMDKKNIAIRKNITTKMLDYWTSQGLLGYAGSLYENKDYAGTYELYKMYIDIPNLAMMQDPKTQAKMVRDTVYQDLCHSAGMLAYSSEKYVDCIAIFSEMLKGDYKAVNAGEYIYSCYLNMGDTAKAFEVIDQCIELFPKEPFFLQVRINEYVANKEYTKAMSMLDKAIEQEEQPQYYNSKATILMLLKQWDDAEALFKKIVKEDMTIAPEDKAAYAGYFANFAYMYKEKAEYLEEKADRLIGKELDAVRKKEKELYRQAIPLFEKAIELNGGSSEYERALKNVKYKFNNLK